MLGGGCVVFGYCLRRAGPSQSAGSSDLGHSQASRPRPACWAAARPLLPGRYCPAGLMISLKTIFNGAQRPYDVGNSEPECFSRVPLDQNRPSAARWPGKAHPLTSISPKSQSGGPGVAAGQ